MVNMEVPIKTIRLSLAIQGQFTKYPIQVLSPYNHLEVSFNALVGPPRIRVLYNVL